jgi:hypothetical protein
MSFRMKVILNRRPMISPSVTALLTSMFIAGCASTCVPTVVEKPVIVERERLLSLPPDLLSPCLGKPPALPLRRPFGEAESIEPTTNATLLLSWYGWQAYAACVESRLQAIRSVQP